MIDPRRRRGSRRDGEKILAEPATGLRRLAAGGDEVEVGGEFTVEALVARPANRPARISVGELAATARAATLLELLAIVLRVHV